MLHTLGFYIFPYRSTERPDNAFYTQMMNYTLRAGALEVTLDSVDKKNYDPDGYKQAFTEFLKKVNEAQTFRVEVEGEESIIVRFRNKEAQEAFTLFLDEFDIESRFHKAQFNPNTGEAIGYLDRTDIFTMQNEQEEKAIEDEVEMAEVRKESREMRDEQREMDRKYKQAGWVLSTAFPVEYAKALLGKGLGMNIPDKIYQPRPEKSYLKELSEMYRKLPPMLP